MQLKDLNANSAIKKSKIFMSALNILPHKQNKLEQKLSKSEIIIFTYKILLVGIVSTYMG